MIKYENNCVDCPQGCINCGRKNQEVIFCDKCEEPVEDYYYKLDNQVMCQDCLDEFKEHV